MAMAHPTIRDRATVIIPCFNVAEYVGECLASVLEQGAAVHAVHCVDNGSSDGTIQAIDAWSRANPGLRVITEHEPRRGASSARNHPLPRVETEWVQFLDADDLLLPGKIAAQLAAAADADVLYESAVYRSLDGSERMKVPDADVEVGLVAGNLGNTCANLWRTEALRAVSGWDPGLASSQEYDLMLRLYEAGCRFRRLGGCRTVVRERPSGRISQGAEGRLWKVLVQVQERMLEAFVRRQGTVDWPRVRQAFFGGLRMLYPHDRDLALRLYRRWLEPHGFVPEAGGASTRAYAAAFRLLGFAGAETVKALIAGSRSSQP